MGTPWAYALAGASGCHDVGTFRQSQAQADCDGGRSQFRCWAAWLLSQDPLCPPRSQFHSLGSFLCFPHTQATESGTGGRAQTQNHYGPYSQSFQAPKKDETGTTSLIKSTNEKVLRKEGRSTTLGRGMVSGKALLTGGIEVGLEG